MPCNCDVHNRILISTMEYIPWKKIYYELDIYLDLDIFTIILNKTSPSLSQVGRQTRLPDYPIFCIKHILL